MKVEQSRWSMQTHWQPDTLMSDAQLVLVFGDTNQLNKQRLDELRSRYPKALLFGCSTAGEIQDVFVYDQSITATAICFSSTLLKMVSVDMQHAADSCAIGKALGEQLPQEDLAHVFVLSDGLNVNGTQLVESIKKALTENVEVTGGLAGDGARFRQTLVIADDIPVARRVAAIGFYGNRLRVGCGSLGGWDPFGPHRLITKSEGNVLYELDGQSALSLYKSYLGAHAEGLPSTGLLFPLALGVPGTSEAGLVRTILSVDEARQSMTFAGDVPEGSYVRLMKANFDRLVDGAMGAAAAANKGLKNHNAELAILISCVGRKLVLQQRVEEEIEAVRGVLGDNTALTGFYSYGEISPYAATGRCELHNQTMTITILSEF
jgi:hypothetical protein